MPELVDPSLRLRADSSAAPPDEDEDADAAAAAEYGKPKTELSKDRAELEGGEVLTLPAFLPVFLHL